MTPLGALQTSTINPARYLGREMTAGTVAEGRSAGLVLLDANPLEDIANVRRIRAVIPPGGSWIGVRSISCSLRRRLPHSSSGHIETLVGTTADPLPGDLAVW